MRISKVVPTLILGGIATVAIGAFVPGAAMAQDANSEMASPTTANSADESNPALSALLNKANAINYEEIQMGKTAADKAGDNQALLTMAKTMRDDHQANEDAVSALARAKNVKIEGTPGSISDKLKRMDNLNGAQFNHAFLSDAVQDHTRALRFFETERGKFRADPDVSLYINQTIPVIRAHLEMARSMQKDLGTTNTENPANNKHASR